MERTLTTHSVEETLSLARELADQVKNGGILCLYGDLGSGKTTFTQELAKKLGIQKQVNSPTFLLIRSYTIPPSPTQVERSFYHMDLYRLHSEKEMEDIGIQEILENPDNVVVIEWSEKLGNLLPGKRIDIHFTYVDEEKREIVVQKIT